MEPQVSPLVSVTECKNRDDVELEDWSKDHLPSVFIRFIEPNGKTRVMCYDKETLLNWLKNPNNEFAKWVAKPGKVLEKDGHGGKPSGNKRDRYFKLLTPDFVTKDDRLVKRLSGPGSYYYIAKALVDKKKPTENNLIRLGALSGHFEVSGFHGQDPGYQIYKLNEGSLLGKPKDGEFFPENVNVRFLIASIADSDISRDSALKVDSLDQLEKLCKQKQNKQECAVSMENIWFKLWQRDLSANAPLKEKSQRVEYLNALDDLENLSPEEALVYAAENGYERTTIAFLKAYPDIDAGPALLAAVNSLPEYGNRAKTIRALVESGKHESKLREATLTAIGQRDSNLVELLTQGNSRISREVALVAAVLLGNNNKLKQILNLSPDISVDPALYEAIKNDNIRAIKLLADFPGSKIESIREALSKGKDDIVLILLGSRQTPEELSKVIDLFAENNRLDLIKRAVKLGGEPKQSALLEAANNGSTETVSFLLKQGLDPNTEDDGDLPLSLAAQNGHLDAVKLLLAAGANVSAKDDQAIGLAYEDDYDDVVKVLQEAGGNLDNYLQKLSDAGFEVEEFEEIPEGEL